MINAVKVACLGNIFLIILGCFLSGRAVGYVPINRAGKTSQALVTELRNRLLRVASPTDIGPILAAEIGNNAHSCDLGSQLNYLAEHLREHGHWEKICAMKAHRETKAPDSEYETIGGLNVVEFDQIVQNLVNLLLSGRVSFSVGARHGPFNPLPPEPPRNEYGFVLYANINNHDIDNLLSPSGRHKGGGIVRNTDYIRVAFRFMDRIRMDLGPSGLPDLQLIIVTIFSENPASDYLRDSILPNGVDAAGNPAGGIVGVAPPLPLPIIVSHRWHRSHRQHWYAGTVTYVCIIRA